MYSWFWKVLPGPTWVRALICLILFVAFVLVCFEWIFPAVAPYMPFNDGTVDSGAGAGG